MDTEEDTSDLLSGTGNYTCMVFKECTLWGLEFQPGETWLSDYYVRRTSYVHYRNLFHTVRTVSVFGAAVRHPLATLANRR